MALPDILPQQLLRSRRWPDWLAMVVFGYLAWPPLQRLIEHGANWYLALMLAFYIGLIVVYLCRPAPSVHAIGWLERYLPLAVTFAPMAVLQVTPDVQPPAGAIITCCAGVAIALSGLLFLRGNFSIMVEGRQLVTDGIYRWIRHPIYLGEIITLLGMAWLSPHWQTISVVLLIAAGQLWRSWIEERKLLQLFGDDYRNYCRSSFWLPCWPGAKTYI